MARINSTRTVKVALWALRIYLLVLLTLIGIKFMRVFRSTHQGGVVSLTAGGGFDQSAGRGGQTIGDNLT